MLKPNNCTPLLVENNTQPAFHRVAAFCSECRCHVTLELDTRGRGNHVIPCPNADFLLHHFRYFPIESPGLVVSGANPKTADWEDSKMFQCSNEKCSARLRMHMRSPRLRREWVELLADKLAIQERAKNIMAADTERFEGHAVPTPTEVLGNLKAYLNNAMRGQGKLILGNNKRFVLSLGEASSDLLKYLGFEQEEEGWKPPQPNLQDTHPYSDPLNILLDDVDKELAALMLQQPEEDRRNARVNLSLMSAIKDFQNLLGYKGYKTNPANRTIDLTKDKDEHPFYAGLGAVLDFHDDLISFAYERQIACDPGSTSYYLECFQGIATGRESQDLEFKAAMEASTGKRSLKDVRDAYKAFSLDVDAPLSDDTIIGTFSARLIDSRRQEPQLREHLMTIGQHRNSAKIQQFADNKVNTWEQAMDWLGFGETEAPEDSFIVNMYQLRINDNKADRELARKCVSLIAEHRKSNALRLFLETGELGESDMDPAQAYARLEISDRTMDDETIKAAYDLAIADAPSQRAELQKALEAIAKDRNSALLQSALSSSTTNGGYQTSEWPVGLENIGNTCYLNSLLQFYFTIRPLRELVLHFEEHKMDIDSGAFARKQVGSRQVSKKEVQRAQRFVYELRKLFQDMIKSDRHQVVPEQELARLTLLSSSTEEIFRRRSTLTSPRPALGEIDGRLVHGPLPPPIPETPKDGPESAATVKVAADGAVDEKIMEDATVIDDASSDGTLVEKPQSPLETDLMIVDSPEEEQQQQQVLEDKENLAPTKEEEARPSTPETILKPLAEASPSRINEQRSPPKNPSPTKPESTTEPPPSRIPGPPNRPPPVPPRDKKPANKEEIQRELEFGAQQDVTEAISNVLFQLSCAIKGAAVEADGEQIDTIKRLFFGKQKIVTTDRNGRARTKEELFSDIKVQVAGPRDIYQALDAAFDEEEVDVGTAKETQYTTISQLPPILQVHISRAQYDKEKATLFKSNHHLAFKEVVFMDRYVDAPDDDDLQQRRKECWAWKRELTRLEKQETTLQTTSLGIDMPAALRSMASYLNQLTPTTPTNTKDADNPTSTTDANQASLMDTTESEPATVPPTKTPGSDEVNEPITIPPSLAQRLEAAAASAATAREQLAQRTAALRTQVASQFADRRTLPYRLHSVFIHRGLATSGHYWIYIYDFARRVWRKYNDGYVSEVTDVREIFETEAGVRPATSSFLVYVKEGLEPELTDAVCREVEARPEPATQGEGAAGTNGGVDEEGDLIMDLGVETVDSASDFHAKGGWAGDSNGSAGATELWATGDLAGAGTARRAQTFHDDDRVAVMEQHRKVNW